MDRELYFSFFMFTVDLRPEDLEYRETIIGHIRELTAMGYTGFDLPIAPTDATDRAREVESYAELRGALDAAGLADVRFTTNVAATRRFDPTSVYREQRDAALAYLKSRVDITAALGGEILAGPIIFPYNVFPLTDRDEAIWSDALQALVIPAYERARPVLSELAEYAESKDVRLAIEPVDHWEQPAPNSVEDVLGFLEEVASAQLGVCIDSAHVMLGGRRSGRLRHRRPGRCGRGPDPLRAHLRSGPGRRARLVDPVDGFPRADRRQLLGAVSARDLQRDPAVPEAAAVDAGQVLDPGRGRAGGQRP